MSQEPHPIVKPPSHPPAHEPAPAPPPKPRPLAHGAAEPGRSTHASRLPRQTFGELVVATAAAHDALESAHAVSAVNAIDGSSQPVARGASAAPVLDVQRLCDRIAGCMALRPDTAMAWAVGIRLRADLLPATRMRLASDAGGHLTLWLASASRDVVEALQASAGALVRALLPWSSGEPRVEIELDGAQRA